MVCLPLSPWAPSTSSASHVAESKGGVGLDSSCYAKHFRRSENAAVDLVHRSLVRCFPKQHILLSFLDEFNCGVVPSLELEQSIHSPPVPVVCRPASSSNGLVASKGIASHMPLLLQRASDGEMGEMVFSRPLDGNSFDRILHAVMLWPFLAFFSKSPFQADVRAKL